MNTLIYLTGEQGSGKSSLINSMRRSLEIPQRINIIKSVEKSKDFHETIAVTGQNYNPLIERQLRNYAKDNKLIYFNLKLKRKS